jgi:Ca2+-binding EF-hand superfamily protein
MLSFVSIGSGNICVLCPPGKYKFGGSSIQHCLYCPMNTFSSMSGASACTPCPIHTFSTPGSAWCQPDACVDGVSIPGCLCTPGTTGDDGGPCTPCARDTFKNTTGSSNCTSCPVNETSTEGSIGCVCEENFFGVSGDCETCPLDLVSPPNSTECFCTDGRLLTNGTCAAILPERLHLTGVFGDDTNTPGVMSPEEIENATAALVLELSTLFNASADSLDVQTWTDTNDTGVRYRVGLSWTGVFRDTSNASDAMTDLEIEDAKAELVLKLTTLYNTSTDLRDVKTWTDGNSTSVQYSVNISWTGVFADYPQAPHVMTDAEVEDAKENLVMELAKLYNTNTDLLHVKTWTEANDTSVSYSVNISWNGAFENTNSSQVMSSEEIEVAKEALVLELAKLYNTSADLVHVHTWTDDNDTSVHYNVEILLTKGVIPAPPRAPHVMTDVEIEDAKAALLLELAKAYNTTTDLLDVKTWTEGNDTSVRYRVELLVTGALEDKTKGPHVKSAEEIENEKNALALEVAKQYNTTTDSVHVTTWTSDDKSVHYRVNVSWTGRFEDKPDPPHVMSPEEIEAAKEALVLELAKLYNTSTHLVEVEAWTVANDTRVYVSAYILFDGAESLNVTTGKFPLLSQVKVEYEYGQIVYGKFKRCPTNMKVVNGSCECVAGYQERDGVCESCSRGTYKALTANTDCLQCTGNTYSGIAAEVCSECPAFSLEVEGNTRCVCGVGFILFNNECVEQQPNYVTLNAGLRHNNSLLVMLNISTKVIDTIVSRFGIDQNMLFVTVNETSQAVFLEPTIETSTTPILTSTTPPPSTEPETTGPETSTPPPSSEETNSSETSTPPPSSEETNSSETSTPSPIKEETSSPETSTPPPSTVESSFVVIDTDGNALISEAELRNSMEMFNQTLSNEEWNGLVQNFDRDGDGEINPQEYKLMFPSDESQSAGRRLLQISMDTALHNDTTTPMPVENSFLKMDTDGNSFISEAEFNDFMDIVVNQTVPNDQWKYILQIADRDTDGQISLDEFMFLVTVQMQKQTQLQETSNQSPTTPNRRLLEISTNTTNTTTTTTPRPPAYYERSVTITCVCPQGSSVCDKCLALQDECFTLEETEFCGIKGSGIRREGYLNYAGEQKFCEEGEVLETDEWTRSKVCRKKTDATLWMILIFVLLFIILITVLAARFRLFHIIYAWRMPRVIEKDVVGWKVPQAYEQVPVWRAPVQPTYPTYPTPYRASASSSPHIVYELHFNK